VHRHTGLDQIAGDVGLQIREGEYQIGLNSEDFVDVATGEGEDFGLLLARTRRGERCSR
jgi:hypothetical protein